MGNKILFRQF